MAEANDLSLTPHSANLGLLTLPTMPLLPTLPNAGKIVELSIEQADYYPCQYGLFRNDPYRVVDGHVTVPAERAGGGDRARKQESEVDVMDADSAVSMDASDPPAFGGATGVGVWRLADERQWRISGRAHGLRLAAGSPEGVALEFWLAAERELYDSSGYQGAGRRPHASPSGDSDRHG